MKTRTRPSGCWNSSASMRSLRHAYATAAHELAMGELTIKAFLGHARIGVTSGDTATVDSVVLAAAENVAGYVAAAMNGERGNVVQLADQRRAASQMPLENYCSTPAQPTG